MGISKIQNFDTNTLQLAAWAKALGHPARIAILRHLLQSGNACVCGDIVAALPLAQSTVSQHLKVLKSSGLLQGTIEGAGICYCINEVVWKEAAAQFNILFAEFEQNDCKGEQCC